MGFARHRRQSRRGLRSQVVETASGRSAYGYETASGQGLWLSRDSKYFEDGNNLYAYAHNRPIDLTDPFGTATAGDTTTRTYDGKTYIFTYDGNGGYIVNNGDGTYTHSYPYPSGLDITYTQNGDGSINIINSSYFADKPSDYSYIFDNPSTPSSVTTGSTPLFPASATDSLDAIDKILTVQSTFQTIDDLLVAAKFIAPLSEVSAGLASALAPLGIIGAIVGTASDFMKIINETNPAYYGIDAFNIGMDIAMTYVGIAGGPAGAAVSAIYFGVATLYPGGWLGDSDGHPGLLADIINGITAPPPPDPETANFDFWGTLFNNYGCH